jgi:hypothetical protein
LKIPYKWFPDFLRGVIDGDGCIRKWVHSSNGVEQWSLRIYSAAPIFIRWLETMIERYFLAQGQIHMNNGRTSVLKYGKLAAKQILINCYYEGCLSLNRKAMLAEMCGKSDVSWNKSRTVFCEA